MEESVDCRFGIKWENKKERRRVLKFNLWEENTTYQ
jgi:hypothetical protein